MNVQVTFMMHTLSYIVRQHDDGLDCTFQQFWLIYHGNQG